MKENGRLERGDFIKLRSLESEGEWATGMVALASDTDPQSVVVMIGDGDPLSHVPLTINYASGTVENLITGERYEVLVNRFVEQATARSEITMTDETLEKTFTWGRLTDEQRSTISQVFSVALEMARTVNRACPESREKALALTHIQNAVLWADAAIAIYGR